MCFKLLQLFQAELQSRNFQEFFAGLQISAHLDQKFPLYLRPRIPCTFAQHPGEAMNDPGNGDTL